MHRTEHKSFINTMEPTPHRAPETIYTPKMQGLDYKRIIC